ncbi:MAG: hypothetical protein ACYS0D_14990, partial [Planctomycetota bacterium]
MARTMTTGLSRLGVFATALLCSLAAAQETAEPYQYEDSGVLPRRYLDQMIEDVSPLGTSLRSVEPGLRQSGPFDQVIRTGPDGQLMRVQGALFALFDQSIYRDTEQSTLAVIPDNTVFWIGEPPPAAPADPLPDRYFPNRVDTLIAPLRLQSADAPAMETASASSGHLEPQARAPEGRILWDEEYRAARLQMLMQTAAQAAVSRRGD